MCVCSVFIKVLLGLYKGHCAILGPPQNQHTFNSHLNYLNLKTVLGLNNEKQVVLGGILMMVDMKQILVTDNYQDEGMVMKY